MNQFNDWESAYNHALSINKSILARVGNQIAAIRPNGQYTIINGGRYDVQYDQIKSNKSFGI